MEFAAHVDALSVDDLVARGSSKWATFPGKLGAWIAEMDFGLAEPIVEALAEADRRFLQGYASPSMLAGLRGAAADWQRARYGWTVDPDTVAPISDVLHGLGLVLDGFVDADAPVVMLTPAYMPFLTVPVAFGRRLVTVPMARSASGWEIPFDELAAALTPGALFVLANPYNPLGLVLKRADLVRLAEVVDAAGALVFSDEIHAPLTFAGHRHVPYASVSDAAARHSITAVSASKAWNLAGLKCAQLIFTNPAHLQRWHERVERRSVEAANPGIVAGTAAYRDGLPWLSAALDYLDVNRRLIADELPRRLPGAVVDLIEGTYLQWVDLRALELPRSPRELIFDAGVAVTEGALCGQPGCVRINLATPTPILRKIIVRVADALGTAGP